MADLIFYEKVVSIDSKLHKHLRLKPMDSFSFAEKTNSVPLVGIEFIEAAREYPIVFVKGADGSCLPVALLGLRENENLFVDADGKWNGRYIPAFVRRYPFVPADMGQGHVVVCFDEAAAAINTEEGENLFEGDQPGKTLGNMVALLQDYQFQAVRTKELCQRLSENDLLVESNAQAELAGGASFRLSSLFVVDEKRLQELDKDKVHALFANGELGLIYAHLMSLGNLQRLLEKLDTRIAA
jgi:hypothetical protein